MAKPKYSRYMTSWKFYDDKGEQVRLRDLNLNNSQRNAFKAALQQEFVIIQGIRMLVTRQR